MHPAPTTPTELTPPDPARSAKVEQFIARLSAEQSSFLDALVDAQRSLELADAGVGEFVAAQTRLTRQFLDAQRALVRRRAVAETDADWVVHRALARAEGAIAEPDRAERRYRPLSPGPVARRTDRAERGVDHGENAQAQLQELLDSWWTETERRAADILSDAQSRAQVFVELADLEASAALAGACPEPTPNRPCAPETWPPPAATAAPSGGAVLPEPIVHLLDRALDDDLDRSLAALLEHLVDEPSDLDDVEPVDESSDAFDRFWGSGPERLVRPTRRRSVARSAAVPMFSFLGLLTIALAWIG